jgi:hypothetical protein
MSEAQTLLLGFIAGATILLGLPVGKLRAARLGLRQFLNALAIGILLFLIWDVLVHPARRGRRMTRPCPCPHHLATRLLNQAPAWMPARLPPPAAGWTPATSSSAMPPCTCAARRSRSGSA